MVVGSYIPNAKYIFHKGEYAIWEAEHLKRVQILQVQFFAIIVCQ